MLADTCTNRHVVRYSSPLLANQQVNTSDCSEITGANAAAPARVYGSLDLHVRLLTLSGNSVPLILSNTLVSQDSSHDVLDPERIFQQYGARFLFNDDNVMILPSGDRIPILRTDSGLPCVEVYPVTVSQAITYAMSASANSKLQRVLLASARLGAPSVQQLRAFLNTASNAVPAELLTPEASKVLEFDAVRKQSVMRQHPYPPKQQLATSPGELVFMDYWGPFPHAAIATNGVVGLLGAADEASDCFHAAFTHGRTTDHWLTFLDAIRADYHRHKHVIKCVLTDRAPELYQQLVAGDGLDPSRWSRELATRVIKAR